MNKDTSSLISKNQYKLLEGEIEREGQAYNRMMGRIHDKVRTGLAVDAPALWENLDKEDRQEIFELKKYTKHAQGSRQAHAEKRREWAAIRSGSACLLAFLYLGLNERFEVDAGGAFESTLKNAMSRVADKNGWVLEDFEFNVTFDKSPDVEGWMDRFENGEATIEEALRLLERGKITGQEYDEYRQKRTDE